MQLTLDYWLYLLKLQSIYDTSYEHRHIARNCLHTFDFINGLFPFIPIHQNIHSRAEVILATVLPL